MKQKGQSMVEMAIALPILLLMLVGVFEVGWAIRSTMILTTMNREAARYAAKHRTLELEQTTFQEFGYGDVVSHSLASLAGALPLDYANNGAIIISVVEIRGAPLCDPALPPQNCDCMDVATTPFSPTLAFHPGNTLLYQYKVPTDAITRYDFEALAEELILENRQFDCVLLKTTDQYVPSRHVAVVVENFYTHNQLLGVPPVSNYLTNPIPLYSQTAMRQTISREQ